MSTILFSFQWQNSFSSVDTEVIRYLALSTVGAQLYALLNMYGDTVNIYRANRNESTLDFKVLELVLNGALDKRC